MQKTPKQGALKLTPPKPQRFRDWLTARFSLPALHNSQTTRQNSVVQPNTTRSQIFCRRSMFSPIPKPEDCRCLEAFDRKADMTHLGSNPLPLQLYPQTHSQPLDFECGRRLKRPRDRIYYHGSNESGLRSYKDGRIIVEKKRVVRIYTVPWYTRTHRLL